MVTSQSSTPIFTKRTVSNTSDTPQVHAPTAIATDNGIEAMWFAGSKEGAADVAIYGNTFSIKDNQWGKPHIVLTRKMVEQQSKTHLRKLGNPVLHKDLNGTKHLFVVGVSIGGWATSKIYHFQSINGKYIFKQIIPLSPFANISHLIRATAIDLEDSGFYLPVYHELAKKFSLLLRFDKNGKFIGRQYMNQQTDKLQPWITPISNSQCLSVQRNAKSHTPLTVQECKSGGQQWEKTYTTNIPNDNNSINIINFNQQILLIHNKAGKDNTRYQLMLSKLNAKTKQTTHSRLITTAENPDKEVSYPTTLVIDDNIHIIYTFERKDIKHITINQAWLTQNDL